MGRELRVIGKEGGEVERRGGRDKDSEGGGERRQGK